jgi:hypothetical protein
MKQDLKAIDFFYLEKSLWMAEKKTRVRAYDFQFTPLFSVTRPRFEGIEKTIARIGAISDYQALYDNYLELGFELINNPEQHQMASELQSWYPLISEFTPKSNVYQTFPSLELVLEDFNFPIFIKGNRQTAKHNPSLCIAKNEKEFKQIAKAYQENSILHWQSVVCREYVPLKLLKKQVQDKVPLSFEFRTFWWKDNLVGSGPYWSEFTTYNWSSSQEQTALKIAQKAANRLQIPFLVLDLALTQEGKWIIIECNDAQESGYAGVPPLLLWQNIIRLEKN